MVQYFLNVPLHGVFACPCDVVDSCLGEASADDLRVLLYLLRHNAFEITDDMCRFLHMRRERVTRAFDFWASRGVLLKHDEPENAPAAEKIRQAAPDEPDAGSRGDVGFRGDVSFNRDVGDIGSNRNVGSRGDVGSGADVGPEGNVGPRGEAAAAPEQTAPTEPSPLSPSETARPAAPGRPVVETPVSYSAEEVAQMAEREPSLKFLLESCSERLGRLLSAADCSTLVGLHSYAGLPVDVILMLVEYCVSNGHANIRYIQKTGLGWADEGVSTHELADQKIRRLEAARSYAGKVQRAVGITGRTLTRPELSNVSRWQNEFHSSVELVTLANEICVARLGKISFAYINSILKAWHTEGVTTPEQVERLKSKRPRQAGRDGKGGKAPSYDVDEFVRLSMKRMMDNDH